MRVRVIGATEAGVMDSMESVCDYGKITNVGMLCVCVHDTRSIIAPLLPHPPGKTDSLLGTIASFVLQHIRLLRTVANIEYYIILGPRGLVWTTH